MHSGIDRLKSCITSVHDALQANGVFRFNAVDKNKIDNNLFVTHTAEHRGGAFTFSSAWHYRGCSAQQSGDAAILRWAPPLDHLPGFVIHALRWQQVRFVHPPRTLLSKKVVLPLAFTAITGF